MVYRGETTQCVGQMDALKFVLLCLAGWMNREQQRVIEYLQEEVKILREIQGEKRMRFTDEQRSRIAVKAKRLRFSRLKELASLVTPQTLLGWHRRLIAKKYASSETRRVGRPSTRQTIKELTIRLAQENRHWGYTSIMGALLNLGHDVERGTIVEILKDAGIEPRFEEIPRDGEIECESRLGGMLNYYYRKAA